MRIALIQANPTVGDLRGNAALVADGVRAAAAQGADLCLTPELALLGYPPRDLLLAPSFATAAEERLTALARELADQPPVLVGTAWANAAGPGRPLRNGAALLRAGRVEARFAKTLLPTYDVFDEDRYFEPGPGPGCFDLCGRRVGVTICEDMWNDSQFWEHRRYPGDPMQAVAALGADVAVNLSASPFTLGKQRVRQRMLGHLAAKYRLPVVYANQVGGNDDLVFAGRSMAFGPDGALLARARAFDTDLLVVDLDGTGAPQAAGRVESDDFGPESETWRALVLGTRDYARKCGFSRVLLGLSGGIDSALTAAVAAQALGPQNVLGVLMPSPWSSPGSVDDSLALARNLGIETLTLPIAPLMAAFDAALAPAFAGAAPDVTEENIQARIRGNLLMALSNKRRALLLTTGNKSELAVGYCTIYGDMSGGLAVISDVPKTLVFALCRWLNASQGREVVPEAVIAKPPSAELRPGQKDEDSLPPYAVLDPILEGLVERRQSPDEVAARGFDPALVRRVAALVAGAEFKRRQAAPGLKITDRAFGTGWRMPLACRLRP
ncbi:NAD+ synthase [Desulfocurvus sp.]|jgi:NAD+ synthetase|uniref:NAD+ synthase n=1 Tax=Desulfocurvus sp. TaxID=2871698 RepID=UPI0025BB60E8|nr:NAD+ synthase [Desulfocurvus sp.]MCK9240578.1 NAD+ synthase [Desulfocurvus sp.]